MSGRYYVGMAGPGAAWVWQVSAPQGVDLAAAATRVLEVEINAHGQRSTITAWTFTSIAATTMVATYIPDGTELPTTTPSAVIRSTLTIDGVEYRMRTQREEIHAEP